MEILYREKEYLYPLIAILWELVLYKDSIINLKQDWYKLTLKDKVL